MLVRLCLTATLLVVAACATPVSQVEIEAQREELLAANPDWPAEVVADIRQGRVALGMTAQQVVAALGPPVLYPPMYPPHSSPALGASGLGWQLAEAEAAEWTYERGERKMFISFCDARVCRIVDPATGRSERSRGVGP